MKNPMLLETIDLAVLEEIDENDVVAGIGDWAKLSPVSKAFGNKGAVCTGTVECQNNCR